MPDGGLTPERDLTFTGLGQQTARWDTSELEGLTLDRQAEAMVESVTDAICDLVRVACLRDRTLYRDFLERVAQRLGDV